MVSLLEYDRRANAGCTLVGECPELNAVRRLVSKVAPTDATVLITGETGTGKDLVARLIHESSRRRDGPYIAVNCAAICESLVDSEIFGHERGSFTSAAQMHSGYFEQASGGTLFLDEIAEMPRFLQAKLLRALENRTIRRVGGSEDIPVDVRFIAAASCTQRDVVERNTLRRDLYYRLSEFTIELPPLRSRGQDVEILAQHFLDQLNEEATTGPCPDKWLGRGCLDFLHRAEWPGNVRELKHKIRRAFTVAEGDEIAASHFEECLGMRGKGIGGDNGVEKRRHLNGREVNRTKGQGGRRHVEQLPVTVGMTVREAEKLLIKATVESFPDRSCAAEILGISVRTLYNRLKRYRLDKAGEDSSCERGMNASDARALEEREIPVLSGATRGFES